MNSTSDHQKHTNVESAAYDTNNPVVTFYSDGSVCSRMQDIEWSFVAKLKTGVGKENKVTFSNVEKSHRLDIQKVVYKIHEQTPCSVSVLQMRINNLKLIANCLGSTMWSKLNQDNYYRQFKNNLKNKKYSITILDQVLACLRKLHDLGVISRYEKNTKYKFTKGLACSTKQVKKQHIAIPEGMSSQLFKVAMDIVDKYHPYRHEISAINAKAIQTQKEVFEEADLKRKVKKSALQHRVTARINKIKHNVPDFKLSLLFEDILEIQSACLLVIQGFSGVRLGESVSFDKNSYDSVPFSDEFDIPLLLGEITKVNENGVPTREAWVTHPISEKAIELAYDMSEYARDIYKVIIESYHEDEKKIAERELNTAFITLGVISQKTKFIQQKSYARRYLKFQKKYNISATQADVDEFDLLNPTRKGTLHVGGFLPKLSPHDFRRTFAVFLVRNKLGNLMTLKHQYKHLNIAMTAWYANHSQLAAQMDFELDDELKELVKAANEDLHTDILFHIFNESETLSGKEGERIAKERDCYAGEIYMSRDEIKEQVKNGALSIVEHPTGFCTNPTCDRICASETSTVTCQHEIVTPEKAKSRIPVRNRLIARFNALNDERTYMASILTQMYTQIKAIEITLSKHNLDFIPFEAEIKSQTMLIAREKL
ncbi:site-specific integrase [Thalassotalea eurytherma]|uniref:Site-specific integrase n=1 Tax=Thalassotalea eurytherma TaxID=1144278 RepID=A0ABQ6H4P4_9GAMM|nr:hypothetical protein [Thalassotalea eurytherma]GLX81715.1 hypothetical protein theurythT_11670 [Thalassotalea eurytherma]